MTSPSTDVLEAPEVGEPQSFHVCPPSHDHGASSTCRSMHHCKCPECREFGRLYEYWRQGMKRAGKPLTVDAIGTKRRIRALHRIGYSQSAIARECERSEAWITHLMRVDRVKPATADRVNAVYDRLCMTAPPTRTTGEKGSVTRTRLYAERMDWPPPLALDDDRIDDPRYKPDPKDWRGA